MRAIIVDIAPKKLENETFEDRMSELENLVRTYEGVVILSKVQKRQTPDYRTYVGSGKLDEIAALGHEMKADLIIFGNILKPSQIFNINEYLRKNKYQMQAWDRVDLILKIFQQHANSPESTLQIQLASIRHMGPRIFNMGMELDRQGGGIGTSGVGETNTEIMKRHLQSQEKSLRAKLEKYKKVRNQNRSGRTRKGLKTVGLVGYTNAGKSTLMNALTSKGVLQEDKLFATLGTSVAKMHKDAQDYYDEDGKFTGSSDVLINDTIGFIRDLPPELIDAFSSTLEESIESDLLLEVVDASDPKIFDRIQIVDEILERIEARQPRMYVFNQIDKVSKKRIAELKKEFSEYDPIFISAFTGDGVSDLKKRLLSW